MRGNEAQLSVIPDAAHSPQLENTDVWLDTIAGHVLAARGSSAQPQTDA